MNGLGLNFDADARLRTIPEERIIEGIAFRAWRRADRERDPEGVRRTVREALARWRALGLPSAADGDRAHRYDAAEVAIVMRYAGWKGVDPFWSEQHLVTSRAAILALHPPGTSRDRTPDPLALLPRRLAVSITRRFEPAWVGRNARLRLPVPMVDAALRDLAVAFDPPCDAPGEVCLADGYAELRLEAAPVAPVTLRVRYSFVAYPSPPPDAPASLDPRERARYLSPNEELVRVTPGIVATARAVTRGVVDSIERVRALYVYVAGRRCGDAFPYALLGAALPPGPPQRGFYDCRMMAALFTALCRGVGLPVRRVAGYLLYPDALAFHHWAEVWIDDKGWIAVDGLTGETSAVLRDSAWIPYLGAVDYRMKVGILPRVFTGSPGVRMPAHWTMLERDAGDAMCTELIDAVTLDVVWTDTLRVELGETLAA